VAIAPPAWPPGQLVVDNFETIQRDSDQRCGNAEISRKTLRTTVSLKAMRGTHARLEGRI